MEKKINVAELLKDCPNGMELDCTMFDDVQFIAVDEAEKPICIRTRDAYRFLTKFGTWTFDDAKCIIFPKGKTTWEGFVPPCPFKDGDIISDSLGTCIFKGEGVIQGTVDYYCGVHSDYFNVKQNPDGHYGDIVDYRLATEEEKARLFQAIKDNGYKWNPKTKTLEKLTESKFKDGDILAYNSAVGTSIFIHRNKKGEHTYTTSFYVSAVGRNQDKLLVYNKYTLIALNGDSDTRLATEDEKAKLFQTIKDNGYKWNAETKTLEKLIEPKFKVGDRIQSKNFIEERTIKTCEEDGYWTTVDSWIRICDQDNWELVPNQMENTNSEKVDNVNHPEHYTSHPSGIECIEITRHYCFSIGNAIKYLWRAGLKKDASLTDNQKEIEDLNKAIWYIKDRIKELGGQV